MPKKAKLCKCGRGEILVGERAKYNSKDKSGKPICSSCVMDSILAPFVDKTR